MRLNELLEGRAYNIPYRWGTDVIDIPVIENPTGQQALVALDKTYRPQSGVYLRGLCYRNEKLYIWDGFKACHDDVQYTLYPDVPSHSSDFTLFEVSELGVKIGRQGDYWLQQCPHAQNILRAIVRSEYFEGPVPAIIY